MSDYVRIHVTWHTSHSEEVLFVGVLSRSGYSYTQAIVADSLNRSIVITIPQALAGYGLTCWARKGRDNTHAAVVDLTLTDGATVIGTLNGEESVEWICHAPGIEIPISDGGDTSPDGSRIYDLWNFIHELGQTEQDGRLFRGESTLYDGPILSGMVRQWGVTGDPLIQYEESLLREARKYVNVLDQDQLVADCQHIGIPMNVIDFTTCAKVALWFACLPSSTGKGGRIRVVEKQNLSGRVFRPPQIERRIAAQQGVLVHIQSGTIPDAEVTRNVMIEEGDKEAILQVLEREYDIHRMSLFPDLEMFRRDMEEGRVRFPHTMLAAGAAAFEREDFKTARTHFNNCVSSYIRRQPEEDGGFFNIVPMRNLAIALAALGEWREALRVADRVLQLATKYRSANDGRVFRDTMKVVADIRRTSPAS